MNELLGQVFNADARDQYIKYFGSLQYAIASTQSRPQPKLFSSVFNELIEKCSAKPEPQSQQELI